MRSTLRSNMPTYLKVIFYQKGDGNGRGEKGFSYLPNEEVAAAMARWYRRLSELDNLFFLAHCLGSSGWEGCLDRFAFCLSVCNVHEFR